jgi:hypothetical protein
MEPEIVIVRAFRGVAWTRWMVGDGGSVAILTNEQGAAAVRLGLQPEHSLGFPKADVFYPCDGVQDGSIPDWTTMRRRFVLQQV